MSTNIPIQADINTGSFESVKTYLVEIGRRAGMTEKEIDQMNNTIEDSGKKGRKASEEVQGGLKGVEGMAKKAGAVMLATFSVQAIVQFSKAVIDVTAKFQKMEAVLTNTLGSRSEAQKSMKMLAEFASKTPFQIDQLTESYIKLANRGFKPSREELTKLGDLASSTGKDFDQLAEALLDATVGEFERLKEFGIKARVEGDKVKFTFKGVTQEIQNSEDAIKGYVISLGDAVGVTGSMAAISATLSGQMSNLSDNWTMFMKELGDGSTGIIAYAVQELNGFITVLRNFDAFVEGLNPFKSVQDWSMETKKALLELGATDSGKLVKDLLAPLNALDYTQLEKGSAAYLEFLRIFADEGEDIKEVQSLWEAYVQVRKNDYENTLADAGRAFFEAEGKERKALAEANEKEKKAAKEKFALEKAKAQAEKERIANLGLIAKLEYEISEAKKARNDADSVGEISRIDARIEKLQKELALVNMLAAPVSAGQRSSPFEGMAEATASEMDLVNETAKRGLEKLVENWKASQERIKENQEFMARYREELLMESLATASMVGNGIADIFINSSIKQIDQLELEKDAKLRIAGEDADQRALIEQEFNEKIRQEKIKAAKADKIASLFDIVLNTAVGITRTIRNLGFPLATPFVALAAAQGAIQAGIVASRPVPGFKDGVFDLKGPGTTTSDSIDARLSRGESVVHAGGTKRFADILKPIIEDKNMTYDKLMGIMIDKVPMKLRGDILKPNASAKAINEKYIVDGIVQGVGTAIRNSKELSIEIDKAGITVRSKQRGRVIKQINDFLYD